MAAIACKAPRLLELHVPGPVVGGLMVFAVAAVGLNAGPTLRHW
jgi:hypothetical protein